MSDLPRAIEIQEEGPREGFQFEKAVFPTERKIARPFSSRTAPSTSIVSPVRSTRVAPKAVSSMSAFIVISNPLQSAVLHGK